MQLNYLSEPLPSDGLFLSSSGGHFSELLYIARRFNAAKNSLLITFQSSDTIIQNPEFRIKYIPYIAPRKLLPLIRIIPEIFSILRKNEFNYIASTGASIALVGYFVARIKRLPFYYIESIARQSSFSLTANILKYFGLGAMFVQSPKLLRRSNVYLEHPIKRYKVERINPPISPRKVKVFVALGTIRGYEFQRAVEIVLSILDGSEKVDWQTGSTKLLTLPGNAYSEIDKISFLDLVNDADILICHAGIGIISDCLNAGKVPLVIPRRVMYSEHVDDHQVEIMDLLATDDLVINLEMCPHRNLFDEVFKRKVLLK